MMIHERIKSMFNNDLILFELKMLALTEIQNLILANFILFRNYF